MSSVVGTESAAAVVVPFLPPFPVPQADAARTIRRAAAEIIAVIRRIRFEGFIADSRTTRRDADSWKR
jgi:hypothetical protein